MITGCPYCYRTFKNKAQYEPLLKKDVQVIHITQFLQDFDFGVTTDKRVTYHDPCDLGRHCGIYEEPRNTIRKIAPNFVELPANRENALCCGAGGGVRGAFPKNSIAMARRRLDQVEEVGRRNRTDGMQLLRPQSGQCQAAQTEIQDLHYHPVHSGIDGRCGIAV